MKDTIPTPPMAARSKKKKMTMKKKKPMKMKKAKRVVAKKPKAKKATARKAVRTMKKPMVKAKRPAAARRKAAVRAAMDKATGKLIGKVVHYYDRIGVAIVDLKSPLVVGEMVVFKKGEMEMTQQVGSMQINHTPVSKGKKGDVIGVKVDKETPVGTMVVPM